MAPAPRSRARVRPRLTLALRVGLVVLAAWALRRELSGLDVHALETQLRGYGWRLVVLGIAATAGSFAVLGILELFALRYAERARLVSGGVAMTTAFVANALSQSIGVALLTGSAVRLRAYQRHGIGASDVARVSGFVTLTATLGLLATGAVALLASSSPLLLWSHELPGRATGVLLGAVVVAYLGWCAFGAGRSIGRGRWHLALPTGHRAAGSLGLAAADWIITGSILFLVLPADLGIDYVTTLRTYLVAQTAGMMSHVPGGAGVFELFVLALLAPGRQDIRPAIVASLVMFRVLYYLLPLIVACVVAAFAELRHSRAARLTPVLDGR